MKRSTPFAVLGLCALAAILVGCLPFPLGDPQKSKVDPKLAGHWMSEDSDRPMIVSVYPFDDHTYVVESREYQKDNGALQRQNHTVWRGWLSEIKGKTFLTLDPLVQHLPSTEDAKKVYPLLRIQFEGEKIRIRRVNEDFEAMKQVKSAQEEQDLIAKEIDNPSLYVGEPALLHRIDPEHDRTLFETVLKDEH